METTFNVVFSGELQAGADPEDVIQKMSAASSLSEEKFREILEEGRAVIFKKGLARDEAEKFQKKFSSLGLKMVVREISAQQKPAPPAPEEFASPSPEEPGPSIQIPQTEKEGNPYAAPSADLAVEKSSGGTFLEQPRKLSAGRGWVWLLDGFRLFAAAPWKWMGMAAVAMLLLTGLQLIPFIGWLFSSLLYAVVAGGLMIGAHNLCEGGNLHFNHLLSGFKQNRNQLLLVGCYALLLGVVSLLLLIIPFGASMGLALLGGGGDPEMITATLQQGGLLVFAFGSDLHGSSHPDYHGLLVCSRSCCCWWVSEYRRL
jgi:hypothetical protein